MKDAISNSISAQITLIKAVFFFSGFSSLIYQVVWQRMLTTYYGVGSVSITLIVSVYMLGLGLGALVGGFLAERVQKKIVLYFFVELLLGLFGLASLPFLSVLGGTTAGSSYVLALGCMFLFLCIPTVLMGTTLPLLTKIYNSFIKNFFTSVSVLYFINTLGAACGALLASYGIISFLGLDAGIYAAAALNFILAVVIFLMRFLPQPDLKSVTTMSLEMTDLQGLGRAAYLLVFITGFLAIGYEIVWFRVIGVLVKESAYAFSTVLSVYLIGIALGSLWIERFLGKRASINRKHLFFLLQVGIGVFSLLSFAGYYYGTRYTPFGFLTQLSFSQHTHPSFDLLLSSGSSFLMSKKEFFIKLFALVDVFFWPFLFVLIPTILMGASFPLISSLALSQQNREGSTVGRVYFWNILGNVLGGIVTGFILLPMLSTETTLLAFGIIGLLFSLLITAKAAAAPLQKNLRPIIIFCGIIATLLFFPSRGELYKTMHNAWGIETLISEGVDGVILTHKNDDANSPFQTLLYINGSLHGFLPGHHFYAGAMELFSYSRAENILIIGYGIGTLTDAMLRSPQVKKVTLVELSATLIQNLKHIPFCARTLADKRLDLIIDDGRRYLIRTSEKYDLIIMDPLKTTWAYSNNLYSQEFFRLAQNHLNEGGILCLFMGGEEVMAKTLLSVFIHVRDYGGGFFASNSPFSKTDFDPARYLFSFSDIDRKEILKIYSTITCKAETDHLMDITAGYPVARDLKPVMEYYLGRQVKEKLFWRKG